MLRYYTQHGDTTIIKRHIFSLLPRIIKALFLFVLAFFLYFISIIFIKELQNSFSTPLKIIDFLFISIILNYAFFTLIGTLISHYNTLIVIGKDTITIIKCTLFIQNDIEVIDSYRVVKIDTFSHGLIRNIFRYGDIIIEQQKNEVRTFSYISDPYKFLTLIKEQRERLLANGKENQTSFKDSFISN